MRIAIHRFDDHGSFVICRSASVRPNHLFDQNINHDYFFKLPLQGAGCPIKFPDALLHAMGDFGLSRVRTELERWRIVTTIPPHPVQPDAETHPIATFAMLLCRRMARCMYRRRHCGLTRAAAWAASTSK